MGSLRSPIRRERESFCISPSVCLSRRRHSVAATEQTHFVCNVTRLMSIDVPLWMYRYMRLCVCRVLYFHTSMESKWRPHSAKTSKATWFIYEILCFCHGQRDWLSVNGVNETITQHVIVIITSQGHPLWRSVMGMLLLLCWFLSMYNIAYKQMQTVAARVTTIR